MVKDEGKLVVSISGRDLINKVLSGNHMPELDNIIIKLAEVIIKKLEDFKVIENVKIDIKMEKS